jgi:hypothetical protein
MEGPDQTRKRKASHATPSHDIEEFDLRPVLALLCSTALRDDEEVYRAGKMHPTWGARCMRGVGQIAKKDRDWTKKVFDKDNKFVLTPYALKFICRTNGWPVPSNSELEAIIAKYGKARTPQFKVVFEGELEPEEERAVPEEKVYTEAEMQALLEQKEKEVTDKLKKKETTTTTKRPRKSTTSPFKPSDIFRNKNK